MSNIKHHSSVVMTEGGKICLEKDHSVETEERWMACYFLLVLEYLTLILDTSYIHKMQPAPKSI